MLIAFLINVFVISFFSFLIQAPVFIWLYKTLVKEIHIDYIYTAFWFLVAQLTISVVLIGLNNLVDASWLSTIPFWNVDDIWYNIICGISVNLMVIGILTTIFNILIIKNRIWDNFFIVFVLLAILIFVGPLLLYMYLIL